MGLKLCQLTLRITTVEGSFGVELPFSDGLFVLHADNSAGKSTCLKSILFALGLEGMLGPSQDIPLAPAVTNFFNYKDKIYNVIESEVLLEIHNGTEFMTVRRQIKGSQDKHLINVWRGPVLSQNSLSPIHTDYIVREPGAATRQTGFHRLLADFIGWELPTVPMYNNADGGLLYMETLFPLMFVEQSNGWSSLRNRFPNYFRIKDVSRRSLEFFLNFDSQDIASQRIRLNQESTEIKANWQSKVEACNRISETIDAIVNNLPAQPTAEWPPSVYPTILMSAGENWTETNQIIIELTDRLENIFEQEPPPVSQISEEAQLQLQERQNQLQGLEADLKLKFEALDYQASHVKSLDSRIFSLTEELSRHKELKRLSTLNSTQSLQTYKGSCPTCQQTISESLISVQDISIPMTIEQNVEFIREQLKIFKSMKKSATENLEVKRKQLNAFRNRANDLRNDIRALKTTLTSQNNSPSYAAIEERIRLEERIRQIRIVRRQIDELLGSFFALSEQWNSVQSRLAQLPKGAISDEDSLKIQELERSFRNQLNKYGFRSFNSQTIDISPDSYFPEHEGFDLQFAASSSDYIRIFWAYFLGLLEISRQHSTNHLGLLILDEPRQQSAREASLEAFLHRASDARKHGQQVIVATSESASNLSQYLSGIPHTLRSFDSRIIAPL